MRHFFSNDRGVVAIIVALLLPVFLAASLGGLDVYKAYNSRLAMQFIVDSAAYSAMKDIASNDPQVSAKKFVRESSENEKFADSGGDIRIASLNADLDRNSSILTVRASVDVKTPFLNIIGMEKFTYVVEGRAEYKCRAYDARYLGNAYKNAADEYVVTPDQFNQRGWVWLTNRFDLSKTQSISLRFYFGNKDAGGADGMTFTIQNDLSEFNAMGWHGESLGVAWHPYPSYPKNEDTIVAPAMVVEFDTWYNGSEGDPALDHTAIFTLGDKWRRYNSDNAFLDHRRPNQIMPYKSLGNIEDNQYHYARFVWDADARKIVYYFDGRKMHEQRFNLVDFLGTSEAIVGFTASTGGARNEHKVCFARANIL